MPKRMKILRKPEELLDLIEAKGKEVAGGVGEVEEDVKIAPSAFVGHLPQIRRWCFGFQGDYTLGVYCSTGI